MVHAIFVDVENFLTHKSFTSLPGGFKIEISGIHIYKVRMSVRYMNNHYMQKYNLINRNIKETRTALSFYQYGK